MFLNIPGMLNNADIVYD